jgi:hypothetical protein
MRAKIRGGFASAGRFCWDHPLNAFLRLVMVALWPVITFAVIPALPRNDFLMTASLDESTRTATLGLLLLCVIAPLIIKGLSDIADRMIASFAAAADRAADRVVAASAGSIERMHAELREDAAQQSAAAIEAMRKDIAAVGARVIAAARGTDDDPDEPAVRPGTVRSLRSVRDDGKPNGGLGARAVRRAGFLV